MPLTGFDFKALDDPEFKEDAVREEILSPMLNALGYRATGKRRIVRSRALEHPFVSIGSIQRKINIIPDYLLISQDRPLWVLDAKAPGESLDDPDHIAQAHSYAIHRDVRVQWYGLSNGRELAIFNVGDMSPAPRFRYSLPAIADWWTDFQLGFSPYALLSQGVPYKKDAGFHLLKLGIPETTRIHFVGVPVALVGRVAENVYALNAVVLADGDEYAATFDFNGTQLAKLLSLIPEPLKGLLERDMKNEPGSVCHFDADVFPLVTVEARRGTKIEENEKEHYAPLIVTDFRDFG